MVIGNGFFTTTEAQALQEMRHRSGCRVGRVPLQPAGNIAYYVSEQGDVFGVQAIQGKLLTRTKKRVRNKSGWTGRLSVSPKREAYIPLQVLTYCTFTLKRWERGVELEFINGNPYDVRPCNLKLRREVIPPEWTQHMEMRKGVYKSNFQRVAWSVNHTTGIDFEDCKDAAQSAFIYLCTEGCFAVQHDTDIVGLWVRTARLRAIDHLRKRWFADSDTVERHGRSDRPFEVDLLHLLPGRRQRNYLRMWMDGLTHTEIASECGVSPSTVSASISRSIHFLQQYLTKDIAL